MQLEDLFHFDLRFCERIGRAARRNNSEPEFHKFARNRNHRFFVGVFHADEDISLFRQRRRRGHLRFGVGQSKIDIHPHHFAG